MFRHRKSLGIILLLSVLLIVIGTVVFVNRREEQATAASRSWQFAVIGDTEGLRPVTEALLTDMAQRDLAFVVHVGDVSSHGEVDELTRVKERFSKLPFPTYYVPGNNDLTYNETIERKTLAHYTEAIDTRAYYSVDYEQVHLVLLDNSYRRIGFSDEELTWLQTDLDAARDKLTFLFYHRPIDVPGQALFGDDETADSRVQNEAFKSLIAQYSIAHIFNGHLHTTLPYQLTEQIPVTITGGGGAAPQPMFGGEKNALYHYYIVHVSETTKGASYTTELIRADADTNQ